MTRKQYRIEELEEKFGEPAETLIPRIVNAAGNQKQAAEQLGVAPSTLGIWFKQNGYVTVKQWVKPGTSQCSNQGA